MGVLRFRLFEMPVVVRGSFLLIAALIGFAGAGTPAETVAWIAIVFVSILIHELGHAFTARRYGSEVAIELNGLGGLTRWSMPEGELTPGRRSLIAAAGSATGLLFGGIVWLIAVQFGPYSALAAFILESLIYVNVFWGLINWLPIRPLDGGHLLESLLQKVSPDRAGLVAKVIFSVTAAGALAFAIWQRMIFIAVLAGWLLLSELSIGRQAQARPSATLPALSYDDPPDEETTPDEVVETLEAVEPDESRDPPN